jgi:hypothetical protein
LPAVSTLRTDASDRHNFRQPGMCLRIVALLDHRRLRPTFGDDRVSGSTAPDDRIGRPLAPERASPMAAKPQARLLLFVQGAVLKSATSAPLTQTTCPVS